MCFYGVIIFFCFVSYIEDDVELKVGEVGIDERRIEKFFRFCSSPTRKFKSSLLSIEQSGELVSLYDVFMCKISIFCSLFTSHPHSYHGVES